MPTFRIPVVGHAGRERREVRAQISVGADTLKEALAKLGKFGGGRWRQGRG